MSEHKGSMKYLFKGEPNVFFIRKINGAVRALFQFDENGEFVTDDLVIIGNTVGYCNYMELRDKPILEEQKEEIKVYTCKKCGEEFDNKGKFLAHTRVCSKGDVE